MDGLHEMAWFRALVIMLPVLLGLAAEAVVAIAGFAAVSTGCRKRATIWEGISHGTGAVFVAAYLFWIIPWCKKLFADLDVEVTAVTAWLIQSSDLFVAGMPLFVLLLVLLVVADIVTFNKFRWKGRLAASRYFSLSVSTGVFLLILACLEAIDPSLLIHVATHVDRHAWPEGW